MKKILAGLLLSIFVACAGKKEPVGDSLFPEMTRVDSIQVLFYDKEDEDRFYQYQILADSVKISTMMEDVRYDTIPATGCSRQGKIYCFVDGSIYNTLYFNLDCPVPHFRYIKNARLYNFPMSTYSRDLLLNLKQELASP
jgi:hypothetical protein